MPSERFQQLLADLGKLPTGKRYDAGEYVVDRTNDWYAVSTSRGERLLKVGPMRDVARYLIQRLAPTPFGRNAMRQQDNRQQLPTSRGRIPRAQETI